ncbi:MAG: copper homeostasis protein CutC [Tannerellaceae bacterium]|jgi:copper homeostasis protein|nr:copper homeostasis protein CutC [Tannerellaceae bacterium]
MKRIIEICANSAYSCAEAEAGGADRVELCAAIPEGGTTPSYGEVKVAMELTSSLAMHVIIRPRGGDFLYSLYEVKTMMYDIERMKELGVQGVVLGCLTADGEISTKLLEALVEVAAPMSVTFHRAFDLCRNPFKALEEIIDCGCNRILTSGQAPDAEAGIPLIKSLIERANNRIIIMPGCGVRAHNINRIEAETGAKEFHTSARIVRESFMEYRKEGVPMGNRFISEYEREVTERKLVEALIKQ